MSILGASGQAVKEGAKAGSLDLIPRQICISGVGRGLRVNAVIRRYDRRLMEVGFNLTTIEEVIKAKRGESANRRENLERAVRRAKTEVRRRSMALKADHLLTLTYRENMEDFERASSDFHRFVLLVHKKWPRWQYVAVAERQQRGAWHWHLAVKGLQPVFILRAAWLEVVHQGNIDVQRFKGTSERLAGYLAKYVAKSIDTIDLGAHRYRSSRGISVEELRRSWPVRAPEEAAELVVRWFMEEGGEVRQFWADGFVGWAASWG